MLLDDGKPCVGSSSMDSSNWVQIQWNGLSEPWPWGGKIICLRAVTKADTAGAIICSLIENSKLNKVEPHAYITEVFTLMSNGHPASQIDDLLLWNWASSTE